jgi:putative ABC transport system ATP-binding protein
VTAAAAGDAVLDIRALRYRWPGAANDLLAIDEFTLVRGERMLLRGASGCGKSTLLALAAGVLVADAGRVALLGADWRGSSAGARDRRRADHLGVIFQQFNLLPYLSVLDNVRLAASFSRRRRAAATHDAALALLDALEIDRGLWQRPAHALSVGQQQRVAAARALFGRPALVIADEPTSALDEARRDAFMALLLRECTAAGSALLFVSHDARLARHFERVVELPALNRAAADGTPLRDAA